jgi:hypothetical protein
VNKSRRAELQKAQALLNEALTMIEGIKDEEEESFENLPEAFQEGDRGEAMQEAIDQMDSAISGIEEAVSCLDEAMA